MEWKVRRTLASSIHELGIILGEEAAGQDLIPIFNGFLKVTTIGNSTNTVYFIALLYYHS